MKPTHDSLLLRVSCLRTHQTVFNKENSYQQVYINLLIGIFFIKEALEREVLTHDFDMTYQRNLSREEQQALQNLRKYDDIIIKQVDKGSAVVIMDKEAYLQEAMRQLNDSEIYQPLLKDSTRDMIKKVNERIQETHRKGNIDDKTRDYLLASGDERAGKFYLLPKIQRKDARGAR